MPNIRIWSVPEKGVPVPVPNSPLELEKLLEDWIEQLPELLESGLTIIGRQITTEAGRLDLLGVDARGQLVVVEIKRGELHRETIAQALDYAAAIHQKSFVEIQTLADEYLQEHPTEAGKSLVSLRESRGDQSEDADWVKDLRILVTGTGKANDLERIISFLSDSSNLNINALVFDVYEHQGVCFLVREAVLSDEQIDRIEKARGTRPSFSYDEHLEIATSDGIGELFAHFADKMKASGYTMIPQRGGISFRFPDDARYSIVWVNNRTDKEPGVISASVGIESIASRAGISDDEVRRTLGISKYEIRFGSKEEIDEFIAKIESIFDNSNMG